MLSYLFYYYHIKRDALNSLIPVRLKWRHSPYSAVQLFWPFFFHFIILLLTCFQWVDVFGITHTHTQVELVYVYKFHIIHRPMIELTHYDRGTGYYCGASSTPSSPNLIVPRLNPSWSMTLCLVCCLQYISHLGWRIQQQEPTLAPISAASTCIW